MTPKQGYFVEMTVTIYRHYHRHYHNHNHNHNHNLNLNHSYLGSGLTASKCRCHGGLQAADMDWCLGRSDWRKVQLP